MPSDATPYKPSQTGDYVELKDQGYKTDGQVLYAGDGSSLARTTTHVDRNRSQPREVTDRIGDEEGSRIRKTVHVSQKASRV